MDRKVQVEVAKSLKEAVRLDIKVVCASVSHPGDDVVRANPELRGRVKAIDISYWRPDELNEIAKRGFEALNAEIRGDLIARFVSEAAGSPQLMQSMCLQARYVLGAREQTLMTIPYEPTPEQQALIFEQTNTTTDHRSLVDVLEADREPEGPSERNTTSQTTPLATFTAAC